MKQKEKEMIENTGLYYAGVKVELFGLRHVQGIVQSSLYKCYMLGVEKA